TGGSTRLTRLTDHQSSPATGLSAVREASAPPSSDKKPPPEIRSPHEIFRARQNAGGSDGNYDGDAFERARRGAAHGGPRAPRRVHRQVERGGRHDAERAESGRPLRPARRSLVCCRRALLDVERDKREEGQATEPRLSVLHPWRRKQDSNLRALAASGFQDRRLQPLGHSSAILQS